MQSLVTMLDEASQIVDFFRKLDEQKTVKKSIKRMILKHYDLSLVKTRNGSVYGTGTGEVQMNFDFPIEIIRTERSKSASIEIEDDTVKVTVPQNCLIRELKS